MSEKKTERTRRTSEKKKEQMKNDIPGTFFDSFGPPSPAFNLLTPFINLRFFDFWLELSLVDLTVEIVAAGPASFWGFVGVGFSTFTGLPLSCWLLIALRPCVA